ncbi:DMT family transporter [Mucilaginibacter sp. SG564]|uniref:DMT family transporter n=1 Tax=Mucilaginibacter sp. SG564 TaxID=2587022 RepID=UPI00155274CB|nr:DMT family transporter [Mucilaginibacter sp. SG564]NOW96205.1 drug/metabolite transporter (DMT)-like permease [Mucilaginibacter sp. SG564]
MNPKISLAIGILCIAFSPIFVKLCGAPPITAAFYRVFLAWVVLAPWCFWKVNLKITTKDLLTAFLGGLIFASDIAVWNISLGHISATISTLLANLAPVWVGLISFFILRKKSGMLFWAGTGIAMVGMIILVGYQNILGLQFNIGIVLAILASIFYSIYIVITNNILQRIGTLSFMFYNMLAASIFLLIISCWQGNNLVDFPLNSWLCFLGMSLLCQLTGWITINYSLRFLESTKVAIALLGQTVIAGIIAVILLHESLQLKEIIGSVIVLAGIAVTFLKPRLVSIK